MKITIGDGAAGNSNEEIKKGASIPQSTFRRKTINLYKLKLYPMTIAIGNGSLTLPTRESFLIASK